MDLLGLDEKDVEELNDSDDYVSSDEDYVEYHEPVNGSRTKSINTQLSHLNQQKTSEKITAYQSADKLFSKVAGRINVDAYEVPGGNAMKNITLGK